ncbi:MAG: hypothetical protein ABSB49_18710, partial [Polyangia bacterium]
TAAVPPSSAPALSAPATANREEMAGAPPVAQGAQQELVDVFADQLRLMQLQLALLTDETPKQPAFAVEPGPTSNPTDRA